MASLERPKDTANQQNIYISHIRMHFASISISLIGWSFRCDVMPDGRTLKSFDHPGNASCHNFL